jgi:AraC family transcriptional regulator
LLRIITIGAGEKFPQSEALPGMTSESWTIEAQIAATGLSVSVCNSSWPTPNHLIRCEEAHTLCLTLSPLPEIKQGCYQAGAGGSTDFAEIGDLMFWVAGTPLECRGSGGAQRFVRCSFDRARFEAVTGWAGGWSRAEMQACLDLRNPPIRDAMQRLAREALSPGFASALLTESLGAMMLVDLARVFARLRAKPEPRRGGLAPWQLRRLREALAELDGPAPGLATLAQLAGVSPRHLTRAFKQATGRTMGDYVQEVRLDRARELLVDSGLPMKEIARKLGFATLGSFSTAFRRAAGETPTEFRRRGL